MVSFAIVASQEGGTGKDEKDDAKEEDGCMRKSNALCPVIKGTDAYHDKTAETGKHIRPDAIPRFPV